MVSLGKLSKTLLFTLLVPGVIAVVIPQVLAKWRPRPALPINRSMARTLGWGSIALGSILYAHTAWEFVKGDGTPSPTDEPDALVTEGVYAYSRNPMYVAVLLVIAGQALLRRSVSALWWAAGMWIGFHNRVMGYEEPHLQEKHGETYETYCEEVPRWVRIRRR